VLHKTGRAGGHGAAGPVTGAVRVSLSPSFPSVCWGLRPIAAQAQELEGLRVVDVSHVRGLECRVILKGSTVCAYLTGSRASLHQP
jgi:hypothetical protein